MGWDQAQIDAFLQMQHRAQSMGHRGGYPGAKDEIVEYEGKSIGRMMALRGEKVIDFVDIALLPDYRGKGIGTYLIKLLLAEARETAKPIEMHVRQANPAKRLYTRLGFLTVDEDAMYCHMMQDPASS